MRRSRESAWPFSSNAITTAAAPYCMTLRARSLKGVSPSFRLMELTMHLPCMQRRPLSITDHFEESIIKGTLEISGSDAIRLMKSLITFSESSIPSSTLISMTCAPFSTCWRAIERASSYCSSLISRANFLDPVTLVRSPMLMNPVVSLTKSGSSPESLSSVTGSGFFLG